MVRTAPARSVLPPGLVESNNLFISSTVLSEHEIYSEEKDKEEEEERVPDFVHLDVGREQNDSDFHIAGADEDLREMLESEIGFLPSCAPMFFCGHGARLVDHHSETHGNARANLFKEHGLVADLPQDGLCLRQLFIVMPQQHPQIRYPYCLKCCLWKNTIQKILFFSSSLSLFLFHSHDLAAFSLHDTTEKIQECIPFGQRKIIRSSSKIIHKRRENHLTDRLQLHRCCSFTKTV